MPRAAHPLTALAAAALAGCGLSSPRYAMSAPETAQPPPDQLPALRVLFFGDLHSESIQRRAVMRAAAAAHRRSPFDLALALGDDLGGCGPDAALPGAERCAFEADGATVRAGYVPPVDAVFARNHDGALAPVLAVAPLAVYVALGNHDVEARGECGVPRRDEAAVARAKACLAVAHRSRAWTMPGRHYVLDRGPARFIVLDANVLAGGYGGFTLDEEVAFVREAADGCVTRTCFVVAHYAPAAADRAGRRPAAAFLRGVARVEEAAQGRIAAWLAGHHHQLQHLRAPAGYDVFVSGNAADVRDDPFAGVTVEGARALFYGTSWGYGVLEVAPQRWSVRFEDARGEPLHCCVALGGGRCDAYPCRGRAPPQGRGSLPTSP